MSPEETSRFREQGCLLLRHALAKKDVDPIRKEILADIAARNIRAGGAARHGQHMPAFSKVLTLPYAGLRERLLAAPVRSAMETLAGAPLAFEPNGHLLVTRPDRAEWSLDTSGWHRDVSKWIADRTPGIQAFVLIDDVLPKGGGTLALIGSHRITRYTHLAAGTETVEVDGTPLPVLEMSGRAGDVYLMDLRLIHSPSINASKRTRVMATLRGFAPSATSR